MRIISRVIQNQYQQHFKFDFLYCSRMHQRACKLKKLSFHLIFLKNVFAYFGLSNPANSNCLNYLNPAWRTNVKFFEKIFEILKELRLTRNINVSFVLCFKFFKIILIFQVFEFSFSWEYKNNKMWEVSSKGLIRAFLQ